MARLGTYKGTEQWSSSVQLDGLDASNADNDPGGRVDTVELLGALRQYEH